MAAAAIALLVMLAIALLANSGEGAFLNYAMFAYAIAPLAFAPLAAAWMKAPRATGFTSSIFTTPTTEAVHFASRLAAITVVAILYLAATFPLLGIWIFHVGWLPIHGDFLAMGAMLLASSITIGSFLAFLTPQRGLLAPVAIAVVTALIGLLALIVVEGVVANAQRPADAAGYALHLFPSVLAKEALDLNLFGERATDSPARAGIAFAIQTVGLLGVSAWMALGAQGPERWTAGRIHRLAIIATIALLLVAPAATASLDYSRRVQPFGGSALFGETGDIPAYLVYPDDPTPGLTRENGPRLLEPLPVGEATLLHLVYYLPYPPTESLPSIRVSANSTDPLAVGFPKGAIDEAIANREAFTYPPGGRAGTQGTAIRIPIIIKPLESDDIGLTGFHLRTLLTIDDPTGRTPSDVTHHTQSDLMHVMARAEGAGLHLMLAGTPIPAVLLGWQGIRSYRRR